MEEETHIDLPYMELDSHSDFAIYQVWAAIFEQLSERVGSSDHMELSFDKHHLPIRPQPGSIGLASCSLSMGGLEAGSRCRQCPLVAWRLMSAVDQGRADHNLRMLPAASNPPVLWR
jgi:hypothetical protein